VSCDISRNSKKLYFDLFLAQKVKITISDIFVVFSSLCWCALKERKNQNFKKL